MDHRFTIVSFVLDAQLFGDQRGVIFALGVVADTLHGVEVVLTLQGVDLVETCVIGDQVDALLEAAAEALVGDSLVPVLVGGAVLVQAVVVEVEVVSVLGRTLLAELVVVLIAGVSLNGGQGAFAQLQLIQLTVLIQLIADGQVGDHVQGDALETGDLVLCVVVGVGDVALGIVLHELLDEVGAAAPHLVIVDTTEAVNAQLVDQSRRCRVAADVAGDRVEVGAGVHAGKDDRVIIGCFDADTGGQHILIGQGVCGIVVQSIGLIIVICCADHGGGRHGGVGRLILLGVQDPLETDQKIFGGQVVFHFAIDIDPVDIITQMEGPDGSVVVVFPALCDSRDRLAVRIKAEKAIPSIGGDVEVGCQLAVQHVPALDLTAGSLIGDEFGQRLAGICGCCAGRSRCAGRCRSGTSSAGRAAAGSQQTSCTHDTCALEEAPAVDGTVLEVDVHFSFPPKVLKAVLWACDPVHLVPLSPRNRQMDAKKAQRQIFTTCSCAFTEPFR